MSHNDEFSPQFPNSLVFCTPNIISEGDCPLPQG
jgi:hypothetical protein